jgi:glycerophosphoryl diester phosphodiesterase
VTDELLANLAKLISDSGLAQRCRVRSFDHRIVSRFHGLLSNVALGVLITGTAVVDPVRLVRDGQASVYCPQYRSVDLEQVERLHDARIPVLPWTVNDPADWRRLLEWNVDGITTDDPAALAQFIAGVRGERNE